MPIATALTVLPYPATREVGLRMHTSRVELRITAADAARIAAELEQEIDARGEASVITVNLDEANALEVGTAEAKRLVVDLLNASHRAGAGKSAKERALIDDSVALRRARTQDTATRIARKMIDDGQDLDDVLRKLWAAAHERGFRAAADELTA
jgi:hypothetical protein